MAAPEETFTVAFARSDVEIESKSQGSTNSCGDCKVRLLNGTVDQMTDEGLEESGSRQVGIEG